MKIQVSIPREIYLAAHAFRSLHDCKLYGLLEGGPGINVERCDELINEAKSLGIRFTADEIDAAAVAMVHQINLEVTEREKAKRAGDAGRE